MEGQLRQVSYTDELGRRWVTRIPSGAPDSEASIGIPVGPPPLDELGLPDELQTALHNQLVDRGILTSADVRRKGLQELHSALMAALKLDANRIAALFSAPGGS